MTKHLLICAIAGAMALSAAAEDLCLCADLKGGTANAWDEQVTYTLSDALTVGTTYTLAMKVKAQSDFTIGTWGYSAAGTQYGLGAQIDATSNWTEFTTSFEASQPITMIQLVLGDNGGYAGKLFLDDVQLYAEGGANQIANGDFAEMSCAGWAAVNGSVGVTTLDGETPTVDGNGMLDITANAGSTANVWDCQFYYDLPEATVADTEYTFTVYAKASSDFNIVFWPQNATSGATQYSCPMIPVTTEWATSEITFTADGAYDRLTFCLGTSDSQTGFDGTIYFDNVSLCAAGSDANMIENGDFQKATTAGWGKPSWHNNISLTQVIDESGASISSIEANEEAPAVYYNLQGVRITNPTHGIYIKVQGKKVTKVAIQ